MTLRLVESDAALQDLSEIVAYVAAENASAADRLIVAVHQVYTLAASMPGAGTLFLTDEPKLNGLRFWTVPGFRNYLVFYRATDNAIEILRIIHGARDLAAILRR